jgi:hypothetical protein
MARSAYSPSEFVRLAKRHSLTKEQQEIIDEMMLKLWNESSRGDIA